MIHVWEFRVGLCNVFGREQNTEGVRRKSGAWVSVTFDERLGIAWVSVTFGELLGHWAGSERRPGAAQHPLPVSRAAPAAVASAFLRIACPFSIACPSNS